MFSQHCLSKGDVNAGDTCIDCFYFVEWLFTKSEEEKSWDYAVFQTVELSEIKIKSAADSLGQHALVKFEQSFSTCTT